MGCTNNAFAFFAISAGNVAIAPKMSLRFCSEWWGRTSAWGPLHPLSPDSSPYLMDTLCWKDHLYVSGNTQRRGDSLIIMQSRFRNNGADPVYCCGSGVLPLHQEIETLNVEERIMLLQPVMPKFRNIKFLLIVSNLFSALLYLATGDRPIGSCKGDVIRII